MLSDLFLAPCRGVGGCAGWGRDASDPRTPMLDHALPVRCETEAFGHLMLPYIPPHMRGMVA